MKSVLESTEFYVELPGWGLRGVLCAANSAFWAWMMGFQQSAEIVGMAAGVVFWVAVFAALCARVPRATWWRTWDGAAALKWAAWLKFGLTVAGWLALAATTYWKAPALEALGAFGNADVLLGMSALWLVAQVAGLNEFSQVATLNSFSWTFLTTLIEGALMAVLIGGIALVVAGWWRWGGMARFKTLFSLVPLRD